MKTSTLLIATLAAAAATLPALAGGISSVGFSYEQTVTRSQPCANGGENQQSVTFGISLGGGGAKPVHPPATVVYPVPPAVYLPQPVAVVPAPVYVVRPPVVVVPYGAGAVAAHNIGMAHAAAAHNVGMAHAAAARNIGMAHAAAAHNIGKAHAAGRWARFHH